MDFLFFATVALAILVVIFGAPHERRYFLVAGGAILAVAIIVNLVA